MFGKRAVVISAAAGSGADAATKAVEKALFFRGVPSVRRYGVGVQAMNWESVDDRKKAKIESDMIKLAQKLSRGGRPKVGIRTRLLFNMIAVMRKAGLRSSPVEKQYRSERGWLGKGRPWK